uniref:P-type domain-containing protein n=1 Tax=Mesocestoides corti TaxID=53468 RepID=A0A5K3F313_MESCO
MRTWILTALLVTALVACFDFSAAKPMTELEKDEQTGGGVERRRRPGKLSQDDSEPQLQFKMACKDDDDCPWGAMCFKPYVGKPYCIPTDY